MSDNSAKRNRFWAFIVERLRRFVVSLKRRPQNIAMFVMIIAFLEYSLNLTDVSISIEALNLPHMGLASFVTFLFSILAFVCMLNSFPHREPIKVYMYVLLFVMLALVICSDVIFLVRLRFAIIGEIEVNEKFVDSVTKCYSIMIWHIVLVGISIVLSATVKPMKKLLSKINTQIDIADSGDIHAIDVSGSD